MARLIDKGTREYTCALIMMFFGSLAAFGAEYCLQPVIPILAQDFNLTPTQAAYPCLLVQSVWLFQCC